VSGRIVTRRVGFETIVRHGLPGSWRDVYHLLIATTWPRFLGLLVAGYASMNGLFALVYSSAPGAIAHAQPGSFADAFFFSVQTLATIGYGSMYPATTLANVLVSVESTVGVLALPIVTGLVYAKFARPTARVMFSNHALITTRDGVKSLVFRMANARRDQIVEAHARVVLVRTETTAEGENLRRLHDLALVRSETPVFALSWAVVHPITSTSPLAGATPALLDQWDAEIVVSVVGIDETLAQTVHARWSYTASEIAWGRQFADVLSTLPDGRRQIDYTRFHDLIDG
jgi:inward rectifier potassium channel